MITGIDCFIMASLPSSEVSADQARESLIAISQTLPDKVSSKPHPDSRADTSVPDIANMNTSVPDKANMSGEEEYRSKLISISYTPPDTEITTPVSPAIVDG